ncbi:SRPBCC family protein [Actimicrobium sp. CCC2.4]|uniref:SRPBCC family protein n=1 Tax=Actimicrobium sp. CCC2.4 TaxID=3048606 RepID=UPI002AC91B88|nr:SRPBCC family protein [Actimicrobium sp. CCC2.4]MEB0137267.1 SRPBCC family protein [Actimicrobium sp. CCC2.4]WPX32549.1 SRPBCC family protein [Actimicrobium sp. CCC2.4]
MKSSCVVLSVLLLTLTGSAVAAIDDDEPPIQVQVKKSGALIIVDADFSVSVTPRLAWEVLTDFDHMARFISNVKYSAVTSRQQGKWQVAQKGVAAHGPLSFSFDSVREVTLTPFELITTHLVTGNLKQLDGTTRLRSEGNGTRVVYHAESIPDTFVPPLVGTAFIASESRHQFEEMRIEMLKRKTAVAP